MHYETYERSDGDSTAGDIRGQRYREYNKSEGGRNRRTKYRHEQSKWITDAKYLSRPIVSVDGEGVNRPDGSHDYLLLAIHGIAAISSPARLSTLECLDYLWSNLSDENINVIFGGSYDFNMWCRDLGRPRLSALYHSNFIGRPIRYGPYALKWMRGKQFTIERDDRTVTINDVVSFFQLPFVGACDLYLNDSPLWAQHRTRIVKEKARRGIFTSDELQNIGEYNELELVLLTELVGELRDRLNKVHLRPRRWNSPGAIAAALFQREAIKEHKGEPPAWVARAARFAYFGGRFEVLKFGLTKVPAYEYDVNSAYPRALLELPSLAGASWHMERGDAGTHPFALYHIEFENKNPTGANLPGPIPARGPKGTICYPMKVDGWIWSPEMEALRLYVKRVPGAQFRVVETIVCTPASSTRPFAFVAALYRQRAALKKSGDGAHLAIKLGLNSLYGKLAQQVGWVPATAKHPLRIPPYHQLEWAGYVTSYCRAAVLTAALSDLSSVIAFETDALFTSRPLDAAICIGTNLGDFEKTEFTNLTYIQSGHYYGDLANGKAVAKYRGVDRGYMVRADVERNMRKRVPKNRHPVIVTRFMGAGIALARGLDVWCSWREEPKQLDLQPSGKRLHGACWCEEAGPAGTRRLDAGEWHNTFCPVKEAVSCEYPIAWINPNPAMDELEELRERETDWELS
jgi:hypothetical protein